MKIWIYLIACTSHLALYAIDSAEFEQKTGLKGTYNEAEKVFKASFPRTDIKVCEKTRSFFWHARASEGWDG